MQLHSRRSQGSTCRWGLSRVELYGVDVGVELDDRLGLLGELAAGGANELQFPWGSTSPGITNQYAIYGSHYTVDSTNIAPVGTASRGGGPYGHLDMVGELYEYVLDWRGASDVTPCVDCADFTPETYRVVRGSRFNTQLQGPADRGDSVPTGRLATTGFRCARTP